MPRATCPPVRADPAVANDRLRSSAVSASQAAEAYNGARWAADEARAAAASANEAAAAARADLEQSRRVYADALVDSYQYNPELQGFAALVEADGIQSVLDTTATMQTTERALDSKHDSFESASTLAGVADQQAESALAKAEELEADAAAARNTAAAAEEQAGAEAESIARTKTDLIEELADLRGISYAPGREASVGARAEGRRGRRCGRPEGRRGSSRPGGRRSRAAGG
ncbi:hypothetical protein [Nocardioides sp. B-3]|uniref:hypothetical protein n=1 Tax=Nocardioides sp. B-3 TaxID=2895565 RepID=UPI00215357A0|nr:hypothetical protein [Nocardioides sp. B-3]UUZ60820.1 hypothetical protein LP418_08770 [Nocardioides sp. B-3]